MKHKHQDWILDEVSWFDNIDLFNPTAVTQTESRASGKRPQAPAFSLPELDLDFCDQWDLRFTLDLAGQPGPDSEEDDIPNESNCPTASREATPDPPPPYPPSSPAPPPISVSSDVTISFVFWFC